MDEKILIAQAALKEMELMKSDGKTKPTEAVKKLPYPLRGQADAPAKAFNLWKELHLFSLARLKGERYITSEASRSQMRSWTIPELSSATCRLLTAVAAAPSSKLSDQDRMVLQEGLQFLLEDGIRAHITTPGDSESMDDVRSIIRKFRDGLRIKNDLSIRAADDHCSFHIRALESLLVDSTHSGWLDDDAIFTGMSVFMHKEHAEGRSHSANIIASTWWKAWAESKDADSPPAKSFAKGENVYFIIHTDSSHWVLGAMKPSSKNKDYAVLECWDSLQSQNRVRRVHRVLEQLAKGVGYRNSDPGDARSTQQTNDYDCGVWVIENFKTAVQGQPSPQPFGLERRALIAQMILDSSRRTLYQPNLTEESRKLARAEGIKWIKDKNDKSLMSPAAWEPDPVRGVPGTGTRTQLNAPETDHKARAAQLRQENTVISRRRGRSLQ
jgi:hypothetical protein